LLSPGFFAILRPAVAKVYIVSFRTHDDRRPSKFIVLAENMKTAIKMAWEHGGTDFQSRLDKSTAQAEEMKEGALRVL
jgi:cation diffusion facilitator CzcD-associated flavoprotein CzcO